MLPKIFLSANKLQINQTNPSTESSQAKLLCTYFFLNATTYKMLSNLAILIRASIKIINQSLE